MSNTIPSSSKKSRKINFGAITVGIIVVAVLGIGGYFLFRPKTVVYQFATVEQGSIAETVSVTGNTAPVSSVSLGFGNSGVVAQVYSSVGENVIQGQVLAELNKSDLQAQIKQAKINIDIQQANYEKIANGATATDINVAKAQVQTAQVALDQIKNQQDTLVKNAKKNLLNSGFVVATEDRASNQIPPEISGTYLKDGEGQIIIKEYPSEGGISFSTTGLVSAIGMVNTEIPQPLGDTGLYIKYSNTNNQTEWIINIPDKQSAQYLQNFNAYQIALSNETQLITNAEAVLNQANASLNALVTTARPEDVSQAKAQVENARAGVQSLEAKLQNSQIVAPISGVITQFDAKVGQFATPGTALIFIISGNSFEIDALISETDVGKVAVGNKVSMTLDAFPNETFTGEVFYIDPAQTANEGVVGYKIKVAFDKVDSRMKSGLTANLNIETRHKDDVFILPQYAILQNDKGTFVEVIQNNTIKDLPVILGLQDRNGNVEIVSGVTKGEQVINIGLKQK